MEAVGVGLEVAVQWYETTVYSYYRLASKGQSTTAAVVVAAEGIALDAPALAGECFR